MRTLTLVVLGGLFTTGLADAQTAKDKADPKAKTNPKGKVASRFNMDIKVGDIRLGKHVMGPKVEAGDLKGRVVLLDYWGVNCAPCLAIMPRTAALNAELADFGLVVLGSHRQDAKPDQIRAVATARGANFPISHMTAAAGSDDNNGLPHCLLFDHTGACIFRGSPGEVDAQVRTAVGAALVAGAERAKFSPQLSAIVQDLKKGKPPATMLPRLVALQGSSGEAGADAKALLASLTAVGQKKLEKAESLAESEPVEAYQLIEKVPTTFKGTAVAKQAADLIAKLKKDKAVAAELAARPSLEAVKKLEQQLANRPGADEPSKPEFRKANAVVLKQLKDKVAQMQKTWPDAKATAEAVAVGERFVGGGK